MDTSIFYFFYNLGQRLNADWLIVFFGSYLVFVLLVIFLFLLIKEKDLRKRIYFINVFLLSEILARGILTEAIRFFYARQRPYNVLGIENLIVDTAPSFPSGHTAILFTLSFVVFLINKKWGWIFSALSTLAILARVMAGVHWVSDLAGGLLVAGLCFFVIYYLVLPKKKFIDSFQKTSPQEEETKNPV